MFKKDELRILWPFYVYNLVFGLSAMIMPFMIIYLKDLGLTFFQISIVTSASAASMFLFEIPTGAFADGFSRKYSVIVGFVITALAAFTIPHVASTYSLAGLWLLAGIGMTFVSGAEESWVISNLNKLKRKDLHHEYFIKTQSLTSLGVIVAPLLAAFIVKEYSLKLLWIIFGAGYLVNAVLLAVAAKELVMPKKQNIIKICKEMWKKSIQSIKFTATHKVVSLLLFASIFLVLIDSGYVGWQPFLVGLSMPVYALGILYAVMAAVIMIVSFLAKKFVSSSLQNVLTAILALRMLSLLALLFVHPPFFMVAALIFVLDNSLFVLGDILVRPYWHKFIPERIRATVISVGNMAKQGVAAISALIAGMLLDISGPQKILAYFGLFGILAIACYRKIKR